MSTSFRVRRVLTAVTVAACLGLTVAACGGDGSGSKSSARDGDRQSDHDDDDDDDVDVDVDVDVDGGGGGEEAGSGGSSGEAQAGGDAAAEQEAALENAVRAYTRAYFAGEAVTAYAMLSERCRDLVGSSAHGDEVAGAAAEHGELTVQTYTTNLIEADSAVVTYTVGVPELDEPRRAESWVSENRSWKWDAC